MPSIYSGIGDSYAQLGSNVSWANARGTVSSVADIYDNSGTNSTYAVYNIYSGGRGGNNYFCRRSYFPFELSGESGTLESATIQLYLDNLGTVGSNADKVTLVEATALAGTSADYGNCFASGVTLGTEVSDVVTVSTTAGYHTFTINSNGITAIQNKIGSGTFTICLMGNNFDKRLSAPSLGGNYTQIQCYYADYTGTSRDPVLNLTYETAVTDNSVFFGCNF